MNQKTNNLELKIYEKLGIKIFRDILVKLIYICIFPIFIILKVPKQERKRLFFSPSNYFMKKGNGLQDLKDFKKKIYFNSSIHIIALIGNILYLSQGDLYNIFWLILNSYCIILQRYNYIRINNVIKSHESFEKKKISHIKTELKEKDSLLKSHKYQLKEFGKNAEETTLDELLENASLEKLRQIKEALNIFINKENLYGDITNSLYSSITFEEKKKSYRLDIIKTKQ